VQGGGEGKRLNMPEKKKILIFHTSVGLGHKSIAENIGFYLSQAGYEVRLADIGSVQKGKFKKVVVGVHWFINKHLPFVWGWLYDWGHYIILPFRIFIAGFNYKLTKYFVDEFKPDLIISTQTAASAVVAYLKKQKLYNGLFGIAFSDFHLHKYWLYNPADFYLANITEQKEQMVRLGVPAEAIYVCGITLKPQIAVDAQAIKNKLNINAQEKVLLLASGSLGTDVDENLIARFVNRPNIKIIAVCGKNQTIYQKLKNKFAGASNIIVLGFYSPMDELYAIADVFITKPGGLSISEALRWKLPIIISHMLPGQEQYNFSYLLKHNLVIPKAKDIAAEALEEMKSGNFRALLKNNPNAEVLQAKGQVVLAVSREFNRLHRVDSLI
jgi:processive 1,2-diacylglycerol beta-glucosyltransferase